MRAVFNVFSGTGNTHKICRAIMREWQNCGAECKYVNIEKDCEVRDPNEFDRIVIGYPVHAFNAPQIVFDFIKRLPMCRGTRLVYLVKTSGEPLKFNDGSCAHVYDMLKRKGYAVAGEYHYVMPYNMVFRHTDGMAARMFNTAKARVPAHAKAVLEGRGNLVKIPIFARIMSGICLIERPGMRLNGMLYRVSKKKCVECMACVNNCPVGNIRFENGKFRFGSGCIGCARCAFNCPTNAITTGLLNCIKVNGRYDFKAEEDTRIPRYCRRSYAEYFEKDKYESGS